MILFLHPFVLIDNTFLSMTSLPFTRFVSSLRIKLRIIFTPQVCTVWIVQKKRKVCTVWVCQPYVLQAITIVFASTVEGYYYLSIYRYIIDVIQRKHFGRLDMIYIFIRLVNIFEGAEKSFEAVFSSYLRTTKQTMLSKRLAHVVSSSSFDKFLLEDASSIIEDVPYEDDCYFT